MNRPSLLLVSLAVAACSVELAPVEKDSEFVPLIPRTAQDCDTCTEQQCPEYSACHSSPSCVALGACISSCTTPSCQVDCYNQHQDAYDLYFQLISCSYQSCSNECAATACVDCERTGCNTQKTACVSNLDCIRDWYCVALCHDDTCEEQCDVYWSATGGAAKLDAYMSCSMTQCSGVCS